MSQQGSINFYFMKGCGFCNKAKDMLKPQIDSGMIVMLPHTEAPSGISGFPHFTSRQTNKSHTGAPQDFATLLKALGMTKENWVMAGRKGGRGNPQTREWFAHNDKMMHGNGTHMNTPYPAVL